AALPALRPLCRGERPRRSVHPLPQDLAGAGAMRLASLRAKLLWGTILVITLVMTGVFVVVEHRQRVAIMDEFQRRGEVLARRIARPVQQLAEGAAALSAGETAPRIEASTSDEIGRLAAAFNHMAVELAERRRALEEAHHELQRQFVELADLKSYTDNILGSLANGIVTVGLDGRVVTLNPAAELLTGFFKGEVSGRYCTESFAHTPVISDILMETLASRAPFTGVNLTLRRRNGSSTPVEFSTAPLKGGEGKDLGVIGVFRDLTLVRRLESDLRRSDRLAALGTLAAGL